MSGDAEDSVSQDYTQGKDVDEYKNLIEVFWDFLLDNMRISHILLDLHLEEVKRQLPRLHSLENSDPRKAVQELLEAITRSPEPQRWNMFFGALRQDGATLILDTLLEEKPDVAWYADRGLQLIHIFRENLENRLNLMSILPDVVKQELIYREDQEQLDVLWRENHVRAVGVFLLKVHRRKTDWYQILMTIIYDKNAELAKEIDEEFCGKLKVKRDAESKGERAAEDNAHDLGRPHTLEVVRPVIGPGQGGDATVPLSQSAVLTAAHNQPPLQGSDQGNTAPSGETITSACSCTCGRVLAELSALKSDMNEVKLMLETLTRKTAGEEGSSA